MLVAVLFLRSIEPRPIARSNVTELGPFLFHEHQEINAAM
jgi:hypothetical protein